MVNFTINGRKLSAPKGTTILNAAEKAILFRKMDTYCQQQTGQTLTEYSAQLMAEDMAPPTQPMM